MALKKADDFICGSIASSLTSLLWPNWTSSDKKILRWMALSHMLGSCGQAARPLQAANRLDACGGFHSGLSSGHVGRGNVDQTTLTINVPSDIPPPPAHTLPIDNSGPNVGGNFGVGGTHSVGMAGGTTQPMDSTQKITALEQLNQTKDAMIEQALALILAASSNADVPRARLIELLKRTGGASGAYITYFSSVVLSLQVLACVTSAIIAQLK
jgi:hypothetical protein